jgi:hypothetical protein
MRIETLPEPPSSCQPYNLRSARGIVVGLLNIPQDRQTMQVAMAAKLFNRKNESRMVF